MEGKKDIGRPLSEFPEKIVLEIYLKNIPENIWG